MGLRTFFAPAVPVLILITATMNTQIVISGVILIFPPFDMKAPSRQVSFQPAFMI